jgi:iron complex transport system substrate-binding protein
MAAGGLLYTLDVDQMVALAPDVVFAQDDCSVCALPSSEVVAALAARGVTCEVISLDPVDLEGVLASFSTVGQALGLAAEGAALELSCRQRLAALALAREADGRRATRRPRVAVLDWVEPLFAAGNWVPDLVRAAGGEPLALVSGSAAGSRPIDMEALAGSHPDLVVIAPCGLDLAAATDAGRRFHQLAQGLDGLSGTAVVAFDGHIWFSRPGPRLVEGCEALAAWLSGDTPPDSVGTTAITEAR